MPDNVPVTYEVVVGSSSPGCQKLVSSDGYTYVKKRILLNGTVDWQCSARGRGSGCPATVKQCGSEYRLTGGTHNHESKPGLVIAIKIKTEVKTVAKQQVFESANILVRDVTDKHQQLEQPEAARPNVKALLKMCNRTRKGLRPQKPNGPDFEIDVDFLDGLGEDFYRVTVLEKERHRVIFATQKQLDLQQKAKTWYIDGTFKVVRQPFTQLLSVHAFVKSDDVLKQLPLCLVLMTRKKMKDYEKVAIVCLLPSTKVQTFVADFEAAIWQALRNIFDDHDPDICGYAFHFGQALWRKAQECGLQNAYSSRDSVYRLMCKVFALSLLPSKDILDALQKIKDGHDTNDAHLDLFLQYVEATWVRSEMWPVESWSVYGRSIRTNNDVEGWHTRLNRCARKGQDPNKNGENRNTLLQQVPQDNPFAIGSQAGQHSNLNGVETSCLKQPTPPSRNKAVYGTITDVNSLLDNFFFKRCPRFVDKSVILNAFKHPDKINIQNSSYTDSEGNNFHVIEYAGKGAFGKVYICQDNRSNFKFAKKTIQLSGNDMKALSSIRREVEALLWCNSEFIVKLIGIRVYQTDNYMYPQIDIYLEYGGISLKMYLTRIMPDEPEMLKIILHILQAIKYLHEHQHAHTDLHAGNILVDIESGQVKLCDLGSVKPFDENLFTLSAGYTAAYFPPTVLKKWLVNEEKGSVQENIHVSGRLDTFALGKLLLEAVTGRINSFFVTVEEMIKHIESKESWELFVQSFFPNILPPYRTDKIQSLIVNLMSYNTTIDAAAAIGYIYS